MNHKTLLKFKQVRHVLIARYQKKALHKANCERFQNALLQLRIFVKLFTWAGSRIMVGNIDRTSTNSIFKFTEAADFFVPCTGRFFRAIHGKNQRESGHK